MSKKYIIIISMIIMVFSLSACTKVDDSKEDGTKENVVSEKDITQTVDKENEAINQIVKSYFSEEDIAAVILNDLDDNIINNYKKIINIEEYGDSINESALIIPRYNDMKISVYSANVNGEDVTKNELLFESKNIENYGLLLKLERPEGIPLIITLEGNDISQEFYYSYNGKDGTPFIEYIKIK